MYRAPVLPGGVGVHVAMFVVVPGFFLWLLAGLWARRMAQPLRELTLLARDLGEGRLDARARLRHGLTGEVGELTSAINEMAGRLEDKIRAERELLAGVSHELRTPLARARLLVELGRDNAAGGRDVWGELEGELEEMDGLVGDLLASARVDFRALSARALDGVAAARALLAKYPGVVLDAPEEPLSTRADATLLTRALSALLDNARKHAGGATKLSVWRDDGHVVFAIEDAGPGFSPEDLARAFEPFYRGNGQVHDEKRGVGLGLALVKRIAEAHGGRAFAENLPQGGARVGLRLRAGEAGSMPA
jgi:signal transduction histidine kinase